MYTYRTVGSHVTQYFGESYRPVLYKSACCKDITQIKKIYIIEMVEVCLGTSQYLWKYGTGK